MKITMKKVVFSGFALLIALTFLLMLVFPVTLRVGSDSYSGSFLQLLANHNTGMSFIIKEDAMASALQEKTTTALTQVNQNVESLTSIYQTVGLIGLIVTIVTFVTAIGMFFVPSMKLNRIVIIPLTATGIIYFLVLISFAATLGLATKEFNKGGPLDISTSYAGLFMIIVSILLFFAMIIVPYVIREKILIGKDKLKK